MSARILGTVGDVRYRFVPFGKRRKVLKTVKFFLMKRTGGSTKDHDFEVDEARWFPIGQALKKNSYPTERALIRKARGMIC